MEQYGVFINFRHRDRHLAGRICDYLKMKGLAPFMDIYSLHQGDFPDELDAKIKSTPYFLCVLTKGCLEGLDPNDKDDYYYQEIQKAFAYGRKIFLVAESDFAFPAELPEDIVGLRTKNYYQFEEHMSDFYAKMDRLCDDVDQKEMMRILNWREYTQHHANVIFMPRSKLDSGIASLENRFGAELLEYVKSNSIEFIKNDTVTEISKINRVKHINLSCYAANMLFTPERHMVDYRAFDNGTMFKLFYTLLMDKEFSMNLILNNPDSHAVDEAIAAEKMGNSAFDDNERCIFLSSYYYLWKLMQDEPYKSATAKRRFRFYLTDAALPFAYFQTEYKDNDPNAPNYSHIKLDLYTEGLHSNEDRRTMLIFEEDHSQDYYFLQSQFKHLLARSKRPSAELIERCHDGWIREWEEYLAYNDD